MKTAFPLIAFFAATVLQAQAPAKVDLAKLPPAAKAKVDFVRDVQPIFAKACYACHGPEKQRGGLRLDLRQPALEGSNAGPVLVAKNLQKSRLLHTVAGLDAEMQMPPKGRTALTPSEIGTLRAWIEQGLDWPETAAGSVTKAASTHWAYQPLTPPALSMVKHAAWPISDLDRIILARLEKEKIAPSPAADRATYIRRLSFDLLGLPPTAAEVQAFVEDASSNAYEKLVDRLLASPHYGERWGRHWLDLARYADSDGYEADRPRVYAFRYRDWVIDAFNRDMPFDQFALEQLAGDLLPGATLAQKTATGFHRNTLTNKEGGTDKEQFRVEAVFDRVHTTFKIFFGLTMNCSQCHDHKYDQLSQREFYQAFAFFNSDDEIDIPSPLKEDTLVFTKAKAASDKKIKEFQAKIDDFKKSAFAKLPAWEKKLKAEDRAKLPAAILKELGKPVTERGAKFPEEVVDYLAKLDANVIEWTKGIADLNKKPPTPAFVATLGVGKGRKTHVMIRGDFLRLGVEVSPGTPAVLHSLPQTAKPTRLDLARWINSPENSLTPRVIVNWVWHHYFGRGIVPTLEDFGVQGERPSHPELLDHLAIEFLRGKSSLKALHKQIVLSATYRQSSMARPELLKRDPLNVLLARQNRLRFEAEIVRDSALAVGGLLHPKIGGPSVKPPQPKGISELTYANAAKWVESEGTDRYRRGMYTWFQRTSPYPMLMTFDAPDGVLSCVRRERTNTPLQSLTLLNDPTFVDCFQGFAKRIVSESKDLDERMKFAFRTALSREPSAEELSALRGLYADLLASAKRNGEVSKKLAGTSILAGVPIEESAAWVGVARTILNLDEFVTRE